jgi:simple sugar transport system permease protein
MAERSEADRLQRETWLQKSLRRPEIGALIVMLIVIVALGIASDGKAFNALGLKNNIKIISQFGIIAIGAAMLMIAGEFDLSIGSMIGFAGMSMALMLKWGLPFGLGEATPLTAFLVTLAMTLTFGWIIGSIVVRSGLSSFIVTLAFLFFLRGVTEVAYRFVNQSTQVSGLPNYKEESWFANMLGGEVFGWVFDLWFAVGRWATQGMTFAEDFVVNWVDGSANFAGRMRSIEEIDFLSFFNINRNFEQWVTGFDARFMWFIIIAIAAYYVLSHTRFGNWIYATGDNKESARANGVPVNAVKVSLFMFTAFCATMFAACQVFDTNTSDAAKGNLMELYAIAIAVVGGTLMTGGFGTIIGVFLGAITVGLVSQAVFAIDFIDGAWFRVFLGSVLLAAVFANERIRKRITGGI